MEDYREEDSIEDKKLTFDKVSAFFGWVKLEEKKDEA